MNLSVQDAELVCFTSGKLSFTCALTNGALWRFFTAYNKDSHLKVYVSAEFDSKDDAGVIIELLKDMVGRLILISIRCLTNHPSDSLPDITPGRY